MNGDKKRTYQVKRFYFTDNQCGDDCQGHDCLGIGVTDTLYTYRQATSIFADWKRETYIKKAILFLDGEPLEQWERATKRDWPETVKLQTA